MKAIRSIALLTLLLAFFSFVFAITFYPHHNDAASTVSAQTPEKPNIILIMADDLGYGDLGSYGNTLIQTPNIDRLAQEGMKFTQFYANGPVCSPTRAAVLTGQYPSRVGFRWVCGNGTQTGLPSDTITLPQTLTTLGYKTFHIGKWHLSEDTPGFEPNDKGYDEFFGFLFTNDMSQTPVTSTEILADEEDGVYHNPYLKRNRDPYTQYIGYLEDIFADEAIKSISTATTSGQPFFISYWAFAPHKPIDPPDRWKTQYPDTADGLYAALVSVLDENIGRVLAALDDAGVAQDTMVIFMSDNGGTAQQHPAGNGGLRGFKHDLYDGGIRVPLIVRWPGRVPPGSSTHEMAFSFDLYPTIAEMVDADLSGQIIDGKSILALLQGGAAPARPTIFWEYYNQKTKLFKYAARSGKWKFVADGATTGLYNMNQNPSESKDKTSLWPTVVTDLKNEYAAWRLTTATIPFQGQPQGGVTQAGTTYTFTTAPAIVQIPHSSRFNPDNREFSASIWVDPSTTPPTENQRIVGKGSMWRLMLTKQRRLLFVYSQLYGPNFSVSTASSLTPGQWNHVAFTMADRGDLTLYINGVASAAIPYTTILANNDSVTLGASLAGNQQFLGKLGDPKFFNAILFPDEISKLMIAPPAN